MEVMQFQKDQDYGFFGGSFDPLHEGHLHVAQEVRRQFPKIQIVFVPVWHAHFSKRTSAPAALRLEWLKSAVTPLGFSVWDCEFQRQSSYSVDTLRQALSQGASAGRLSWILGADAYADFPKWKEPESIRSMARLVVINRSINTAKLEAKDPRDLALSIPPHPASSTAIRAGLREKPARFEHLPPAVKNLIQKLEMQGQNPYT